MQIFSWVVRFSFTTDINFGAMQSVWTIPVAR
jgi:hypothetical protein